MAFDSALTNGQLESLRGTSSIAPAHRPQVHLSLCANTTVYSGRLNQSSFNYPEVALTVDGGSGTAADIKVNMTILFSRTNDRLAAYARGRIRATPDLSGGAGTLYINESYDDFADNDYYFIINDFAVQEILPADVAGKPVPDVDTAFRRLKPMISGLRSCYADFVSGSTYSQAFAPTVLVADADATSTLAYQWTLPSGAAITSGTASDKNVTIAFNAGFANWVTFEVLDSNGTIATFRFHVWAHDRSSNLPTLLEWDELQIEQSISHDPNAGIADGYGASVAAFDGIDTVLDNTLVCVWVAQTYNGSDTDIGSAGNILMVGRLRNENNPTAYDATGQQDAQTQFQIEGVLQQLASLPAFEMEILQDTAPDEFNEIESLTIWRAIWLLWSEYSTAASLHSLSFFEAGSTYRYGPGLSTQGGDMAAAIADLAQSLNAVLQDNPAGMCQVARRGPMMNSADRAALPTIANWGSQDYLQLPEFNHDHKKTMGRLRGDGGFYNTASDVTIGYDVMAGGSGAGEVRLNRQVLEADQSDADARAELEQRAGDALAAQQPPETVTLEMPSGYHGLTPDAGAWHTLTLPASATARGRVYTSATRWQLLRKSLGISPVSNELATRCTFYKETDGRDGRIIDWPAIAYGDYPVTPGDIIDPIFPPTSNDGDDEIDLGDGDADNGTFDGDKWNSECDGGQNYIDVEFSLGGAKTIAQVRVTTTATAGVPGTWNTLYLRLNGQFRQPVGRWKTQAGTVTYVFNLAGIVAEYLAVRIYGDDDDCVDTISLDSITYTTVNKTWSHTFDFLTGNLSWVVSTPASGGPALGLYVAGLGWRADGVVHPTYYVTIRPPAFLMPTVLTSLTMYTIVDNAENNVSVLDETKSAIAVAEDVGVGAYVLSWTGEDAISGIFAYLRSNGTSLAYIRRLVLTGRGRNPFTGV